MAKAPNPLRHPLSQELNDLENLYPRVKNYHITVKELGKEVLFLHKLEPEAFRTASEFMLREWPVCRKKL